MAAAALTRKSLLERVETGGLLLIRRGPPMVAFTGFVLHVTTTLVTLAVTLLALPAFTPQVCVGLLGCV